MSSLTYSADLELPPSTPQLSRFNPHDGAISQLSRHLSDDPRHTNTLKPITPLFDKSEQAGSETSGLFVGLLV